eukprot:763838-Hanusia_phi.AAC.4
MGCVPRVSRIVMHHTRRNTYSVHRGRHGCYTIPPHGYMGLIGVGGYDPWLGSKGPVVMSAAIGQNREGGSPGTFDVHL